MSSQPIESLIGNSEAFPVLRRWNFLNHGGVTAIPRISAEAIQRYAEQAVSDVYIGTGWYAGIEKLRDLCAAIINSHRDEIALVKNTGEGLSIVANGIDWQPGDVIVTTAIEYPSNIYPWMEVCRRHGCELKMVPEEANVDGSRSVPIEPILEAAADPRCRMVTISHVEFASGQRHDVARIGQFCRDRGILFCVDAIQSIGVLPADVRAMNIDYLSADGHKWMLGPEGAGFFYCRRELLDQTRPLSIGWSSVVDAQNYGDYNFTLRPDAARFECGTPNVPGLLGLKASLELLQSVGIEKIAARVKVLTDRLTEKLPRKGYQVISPRGDENWGESWSGIVSFVSPEHDHKRIQEMLRTEKKIEIAFREKRLRASPHFYNTDEQIDQLVEALPGH
jgi:selenocysteine lyase/cysteine desulfurase